MSPSFSNCWDWHLVVQFWASLYPTYGQWRLRTALALVMLHTTFNESLLNCGKISYTSLNLTESQARNSRSRRCRDRGQIVQTELCFRARSAERGGDFASREGSSIDWFTGGSYCTTALDTQSTGRLIINCGQPKSIFLCQNCLEHMKWSSIWHRVETIFKPSKSNNDWGSMCLLCDGIELFNRYLMVVEAGCWSDSMNGQLTDAPGTFELGQLSL